MRVMWRWTMYLDVFTSAPSVDAVPLLRGRISVSVPATVLWNRARSGRSIWSCNTVDTEEEKTIRTKAVLNPSSLK
ncbi:hypothetical protein BDN71DRAFT_1453007 [Pleurotus eryngii]|uniref:Uncharacterized protein n=1 Tax=Pleurotus eryngii TaxID=5323 RepID=A0A9P6DC14_PLEER|nr:hypothetical protein BDN71DRAFT_1453007 [Pleurotus eryngii]